MKIAILTYGSQGDVEPFAALGQRFCQAGHQVRLAAPAAYQSRFDLQGIRFIPLPGDPGQLVQNLVETAGSNRIRMFRSMAKFVIPLATQVFDEAQRACQEADVILHSFLLTSTGIGLGTQLGIPTISAQLFPVFSPTAEFPAPTFPDLPLGGGYRRLTHTLVSLTFKWGSRFLYQRVRKKNPHLPQLTDWIPGVSGNEDIPILYGFSPHVVSPPRDWQPNAHLTGYWLPEEDQTWEPAGELVDFLAAGPAPITIAFGSTRSRRLVEIKHKLVTAILQTKQRCLLVSGQPDSTYPSSDVLQVAYVPYSWLFKRSAAVIHHGGAGTTARGLLAGVPNLILPFTSDQPFWGRQVHALGAGPKPIPTQHLSVPAIESALAQVLTNQDMKDKAHRISELLREEDGPTQALQIIERTLKR